MYRALTNSFDCGAQVTRQLAITEATAAAAAGVPFATAEPADGAALN
jgi:hypothetical protein